MAARELVLLLSFLAVGVNSAIKECKKIDDCSCTRSNGKTMSLKSVDSKSGAKFTGIKQDGSTDLIFSWNPCTKFSSGTGCNNVLLCQSSKSGQSTIPVAVTVKSFTENEDDGSIVITYNEVSFDDAYTRKGVIVLKCDEKQNPGKPTDFQEKKSIPDKESQYTTTFASKYVCSGGDVPGGGRGSGGLSIGSILLIVFIPLIFVYFIAGLLYNKYHKGAESFPEMIPNHSFWGDLPFLVKDGFVFTFLSVDGCCKSLYMKIKGDSYAKI